ncbi:sensor histidine kinase [Pleionea sp. CnH1-48]|uniref:sensor histidine kinase n=1 Tax=Pleionea sp. CnH1-48 TaxID=2954494 RepID=UPI002096A100|nr:histidine kinase [Pleionea sp. CnH1-48]MCO7227097.1 histidine kinase [Pleionea sp. CnH1-48]
MTTKAEGIIPDFCQLPNVFLTVLLSEILAVLVTILGYQHGISPWFQLGLHSLFIVWNTLCSAAVLCLLRDWLNRRSVVTLSLFCIATVLTSTLISSLVAMYFYHSPSLDLSHPVQQVFIIRNEVAALLISAVVLRYLYLNHQYRLGIVAESNARFDSLQARIHPHFLFNTLNTIASLIAIDQDKAERTLENLSALMRSGLKQSQQQTPLKQELSLCRAYADIEHQRLGERLSMEWQIDPSLEDWPLPPFTLQPLIENAIYHGIQSLPEGGTVRVEGYRKKQSLVLKVTNPTPDNAPPHGNQSAHQNIQQRLLIRYGADAKMRIEHEDNTYRVTLVIPQEPVNESLDH